MLKSLEDLSKQAVDAQAEVDSEHANTFAGKLAFLSLLVAVVRPALPAICSKVPISSSGKASCYGRSVDRWMAPPFERAVLLGGSERPDPPAAKVQGIEDLRGAGLYLSESGDFFETLLTGMFRWYSTPSASYDDYWWSATVSGRTLERVLEKWRLDQVVIALSNELEIQVAGKKKAAAKARSVAERVKRAAALLEGIR